MTLCAVPYDITASAFYFNDADDYEEKYNAHRSEEFELQAIDIDNHKLFAAAQICQSNIQTWFADLEHLADDCVEGTAIRYLLDLGYSLDEAIERHDEVQIHHGCAKDYAIEITDISEVPAHIAAYIDFDAIARDFELSGEITEFDYELYITNSNCF